MAVAVEEEGEQEILITVETVATATVVVEMEEAMEAVMVAAAAQTVMVTAMVLTVSKIPSISNTMTAADVILNPKSNSSNRIRVMFIL